MPARAHTLASRGRTKVGQDVITGAFTDYGVDHADVAGHGNVSRIVLSRGSFEVDVEALDNDLRPLSQSPTTCVTILKGTGPIFLSDGSGAYRGIEGTITVTEQTTILLPKLSNGTCNETETVKPLAGPYWVTGSGSVNFG